MSIDPELQAFHDENLRLLKNLEVAVYRGLHVSATEGFRTAVDSFLDIPAEQLPNKQEYPPEAWEKLINHRHMIDCFWGMGSEGRLDDLASEVSEAWTSKLAMLDARYRVIKYDDENGPTVTFYLDRST